MGHCGFNFNILAYPLRNERFHSRLRLLKVTIMYLYKFLFNSDTLSDSKFQMVKIAVM